MVNARIKLVEIAKARIAQMSYTVVFVVIWLAEIGAELVSYFGMLY